MENIKEICCPSPKLCADHDLFDVRCLGHK